MDYADIAPIMGELWSPIAAVTSSWRGQDNAQIAVAISGASIVPDKPRVAVQLYKRNLSHDMVYGSGAFCLNFLREDQLQPIHDFGLRSGRDVDKLADYEYQAGSTGGPLLADCWGYLQCSVVNGMDGGDMTCFLADVVDGATRTKGGPLTWRHARRAIPAEWTEQWDRKIEAEIAYSSERMTRIDPKPWSAAPAS
jgi:flavin reductase (DIM6/NTAB) family NADH-FMN oxidoreductase RutF